MITNAENRLSVTFPNELKELLLEMDGYNLLLLSVKQIIEYNVNPTNSNLAYSYEQN